MTRTNAKQPRSLATEKRFLNALHVLLRSQSFNATSIQQIADTAGLNKAAFIKRFGTKRQALLALYEDYCDSICSLISEEKRNDCGQNLVDTLERLSRRFESILLTHLPANRAMYELFLDDYATAPQTKTIFLKATELINHICLLNGLSGRESLSNAFFSTQILVTLNYNYCIQAMPAFPSDSAARHKLIARLMVATLETRPSMRNE